MTTMSGRRTWEISGLRPVVSGQWLVNSRERRVLRGLPFLFCFTFSGSFGRIIHRERWVQPLPEQAEDAAEQILAFHACDPLPKS